MVRDEVGPVTGKVRNGHAPGFAFCRLLAATGKTHVPVFTHGEEALVEFTGMIVGDFAVVLEPHRTPLTLGRDGSRAVLVLFAGESAISSISISVLETVEPS